jgi:hypothetical protein
MATTLYSSGFVPWKGMIRKMDDLSGKINELFSNPDSMEMIKNLMGMLGGNGGENHEEEKKPPQDDLPFDPSVILKIKKAFDLMKKDDPRVTFLLALKPNLSEERCKKVDEAIHLLKLINLLPLLQDGILQ